jgi:transcriptional regulator with XRE-family HTH domain
MSVHELGKALTQARNARGLTLHDVERDTRISSKYLKALEEGQLEALPAPVYARAFMRTYAQYLGLNARDMVQQMPGAKPEPELPPFPDVTREARLPLLSGSWLIAGVVVVLMLVVGLVLFWNRGGDDATVTSGPPPVDQPVGEGAEEPQPPAGAETEPLDIEPGVMPDVRGRPALVAVAAVRQAGFDFFIIEVENDDAEPETVYQQSPSPGTELEDGTVATLVVAR